MHSYQLPTADGWRWSPGWRTRREGDGRWIVQRWTGADWETISYASSYAEARKVPDTWQEHAERGIRGG
jgi:hypothetical protein